MTGHSPLKRLLILIGLKHRTGYLPSPGSSGKLIGALAALLLVCLGAGGKRRTLSPVIFPHARDLLRFDHRQHTKVDCQVCHSGITRSINTKERHFPPESKCRACHPAKTRRTDLQKSSTDPGCKFCHVGYSGLGIPQRSERPAANLRFNHRLHLQRGTGCSSCHDLKLAMAGSYPRMKDCQRCHRAKGASNRCVVCHLANKDGRLKTKLSSGKLIPSGTLQGDQHNSLFYRKHGAVARSARKYCENCHTSQSCTRCHNNTLRPMSIHGGDYIRLHALDARQKRTRCTSCHHTQSFCLGCHQRLGVGTETSRSGFKPHTSRPFHGPGFTSYTAGPGHHSFRARRNISTCTSCHQEQTCIRCHGSRKLRRGGFSPHGPNFRGSLKCRSLSSRNQRVCLKCHAAGDAKIQCR